MLKVKCTECGRTLPMKETSRADDRILCSDCYERLTSIEGKVAPEFIYQVDPTLCARCGLDNGSNSLPTLAAQPMCQQCTDYLRNRPFPSWIRISFAGLIIFVVLAAAWNMRFFLAWRDSKAAFLLMRQDTENAAARMRAALNRVPESPDLQMLSAYFDGIDYIRQDKPEQALASLEKCQHSLPPSFEVDTLVLDAKAGVAFNAKDYDRFVLTAQQMVSKNPDLHYSHAMLASAYACKYAVTTDLAFHEKAMAALDRARAIGGSDPSFKEYEQRILHRLNTQEIITGEEFHGRFPNGWQKKKEQ